MKKVAATSILAALVLVQSCGASSFATQLRVILASAGPLIESLNLGERKQAVILGFSDLATSAATLAENLKTCTDNPCKLNAVSGFKVDFDRISARGIFGTHPKLQKVGEILDGIIASARIYYGGGPRAQRTATAGPAPPANPASDLDAKLKELRAAMKP